ncbi:MAG TPA: hypothetical protein VFI49_11030 [Rudaea sp.]|nr:hypothetical protein [Rudaea sp.]
MTAATVSPDNVVYATARGAGATVRMQDAHFEDFEAVRFPAKRA